MTLNIIFTVAFRKFLTFDEFKNKHAIMGNVNTHASSVVICTHHVTIVYMIVYEKTVDIMCTNIEHHSRDEKASMQQRLT